MCLIVFAWKIIPALPFVAAANRDEFYDRPTAAAHWWEDCPAIYAGRDLRGGGTWMGISRGGRFAAVTNVRAPNTQRNDAPSRGLLVADYLKADVSPQAFVEALAPHADTYAGFNLLIGDCDQLIWFGNRTGEAAGDMSGQLLSPGIYGLSNGVLNSRWPKVMDAKAQFASLLFQSAPEDAYFEMLADTSIAPDERLPNTGVSREWERRLSAICIESPTYGTRSSTLLHVFEDGTSKLVERTRSRSD